MFPQGDGPRARAAARSILYYVICYMILYMIDIEGLSKYKLRSFLKNFGFIDCENVRDALIDMYDCNPTFSELKKKLYIAAYNLNRGKTEYFSVDTHPHMHVVDAICMSISIPFVASTKPYNGMIYIDGGTKEITPLEPFIGKPAHRVVSFTLRNEEKYIEKILSIKLYPSFLFFMSNPDFNFCYLIIHKSK